MLSILAPNFGSVAHARLETKSLSDINVLSMAGHEWNAKERDPGIERTDFMTTRSISQRAYGRHENHNGH